jgi:hypothetical protein
MENECKKCGGELATKLVGDEVYEMCTSDCGYYEA